MKRPLGLWILLSAGILWLNTQDVHGVRATSLIFGKSSTTTTTTSKTTASSGEISDSSEEEPTTEADGEATNNGTKHLTGIPQIDYIWDPNLPKELNGYNLSHYPFYERVPENITFKCDGLHDGFYASVEHKCQVYHHCLFGTRFDFLCANYTAFDQKTFICHFASEVDCSNSKRFWHRNDALYQAVTTTTSKPLVIYTTAAPPPAPAASPGGVSSAPGLGQRRVVGRPYRRRRPYYEYYDDYYDDFYYDDRPRSRGRKRPRPRPRPLYDDEYEDEYDDDRYERRGSGGRRNENRRPSIRRPSRGRNKDRPRYDYDDDAEDKYEDEDVNTRYSSSSDATKQVLSEVYHHCLFGIRYDFLCANYTAFDQTLFNCNFVSKVDCKNSKNFWSRNDELYKTKSTPPPPVVYSFYTQSPPTYPAASGPSRRNPLLRRIPPPNVNPVPVEAGPAQQLPPQSGVEIPVDVAGREIPQVPEAPRRRPLRPRPYYDYYDDYDEPQYYRRKRPRPRPYYDDDEYEYYDERYERRGEGRRRRPYDRPTRRYKGRRDKYEDEEDEMYDEDERYADDEEPRKRKVNRGGAMSGSKNKPRRQPPRRQNPVKSNKKQPDYYYDDEYDDKPVHRRPQAESSKNRNPSRRPSYEYEDEEEVDNNRKNRRGSSTDISSESKTMIKPTSGTLFDRPRVAPKINLPVPKNVADKFSYKAMSAKTKETIPTDEYSDKPTTNKYAEKITTPETHDAITTMRGNFKRQPYGSRRPNEGKPSTSSPGRKMKPVQLDESEEDEEIQEEDVLQKDSKRLQNHERRGYLTRYNMFKTRHSLSTPEAREEEDPDDLTEIDDSINEA